MMKKTKMNRIISLLLVFVLLFTTISGCGKAAEMPADTKATMPTVDTDELVENIVESIQTEIEGNDDVTVEDIVKNTDVIAASQNWEDYVGDIETFVYGLLIRQIGYKYDVFPAVIDFDDGSETFGLAYTDYSECFADDEGTNTCFSAGMIPFYGENAISQEEFDKGLFIHNLDYEDPATSFVMKYSSDSFYNHCVVYGQYLKYGVNEKGVITYEVSPYEKGKIDESLGSLYSYDDERFLYDTDVANNVSLSGESLAQQIDYDELEKEINRILEEQDFNFASVDLESYAYASREAINAYFLAMQEETFLGYPVAELVKLSEELDPMQCFRITDEGLTVIDIEEAPKEGEEALVKWLVGTGCVILTAVGVVGSMVFIECPPLSAAFGSISGVAIEVFMQVVVSNEKLSEINWGKVALSAATGAISGFLGPYIIATYGGASYFFIDSGLDGLLGGIEYAVSAWMEGESGIEVAKSFGTGLALGFALSAGFKGVGKVIGSLAKKVVSSINKAGEKIFPKLAGKVSKIGDAVSAKVGNTMLNMKKVADSSVFHSRYISKKMTLKQLAGILASGDDELVKKAFDNLGVDDIFDADGNPMAKTALKEVFDKADNDTVLAYFKVDGETVQIKKLNGMVGIVFDKAYQSVSLPYGITSNREDNFREAAKVLKEEWSKDTRKIPQSIKNALDNKGFSIDKIEPDDLVDIIQKSDWVIHENMDLKTITLVPRKVHAKISHMGGVGLAKHLKAHMGKEFFDRFLSAASTTAVEAVY